MARTGASETDGVLRCWRDQLPPGRCVRCGGTSGIAAGRIACNASACTPKVWVPAVLAVVVAGSTSAYGVLHGFGATLAQTVTGYLLAGLCVAIAVMRVRLNADLVERADGMLHLKHATPAIATEVIALGSDPRASST